MLTPQQVEAWERDGFVVLEGFVDEVEGRALMDRAAEIIKEVDRDIRSVFTTIEQTRTSDEWFLGSGDQVRAFFEADAFDERGELRQPIEQSINKLGHAMHDLDPVYERFSRNPALAEVAADI